MQRNVNGRADERKYRKICENYVGMGNVGKRTNAEGKHPGFSGSGKSASDPMLQY
jgi:hypothetical protein